MPTDGADNIEMMDAEEDKIARSSGSTFAKEFQKHVELGHTVLYVVGDSVVRLTADGKEHFVKDISPSTSVQPGTKIKIR